MLKIIIDSTCDLEPEFITKYEIDTISLQVIINNKSHRDIKEIDVEYLYEAIHRGADVKTSLPILSDIKETFTKYLEAGDDVIFFTFSSKLSGTYNAARVIAEELQPKYENKIAVVDTKNGGKATALIVQRFLFEHQNYSSFEEKILFANSLAAKMRHIFLVNDLTQLKKGGRIGLLKALMGTILHIKPVLHINDGAIEILKTTIGQKRALNEMIKYLNNNVKDKSQLIGINYVEELAVYEATIKLLRQNGYHSFSEQRLASVMTAHIGLDAVSISFFVE